MTKVTLLALRKFWKGIIAEKLSIQKIRRGDGADVTRRCSSLQTQAAVTGTAQLSMTVVYNVPTMRR